MRSVVGAAAVALAACTATVKPEPGNHTVTVSWQSNHEKGVNGTGGGYHVAIDGGPSLDLPYDAGAGLAPTSITTVLYTGTHVVAVSAYQPTVGGAGTTTSPPASLFVVVP
jgi:hypothetical protein